MKQGPPPSRSTKLVVILLFLLTAPVMKALQAQSTSLELTRPVRTWEFVDAVGQRAALFGSESGKMEAWVYPLKLFRDFELRIHAPDRVIDASELARQIVVRPDSSSIIYANASFNIRETFIVPPNESGGIIRIDVDTFMPIQVEAKFVGEFQLMWPAALGDAYMSWDEKLKVFAMGHELKHFAGILGSPDTVDHRSEYFTNYGISDQNSLLLKPLGKGHWTQYIYFTASSNGVNEALATYNNLLSNSTPLQVAAQKYYADYLQRTVSLQLPDADLQAAYDWSRISVLQGLVNNPQLGTGLVAGYRGSGYGTRPGFAWFFGRDSLWIDLALDAAGDFSTTRTALEFITKYQRADGKIPHEISQSAGLVPWFKDYVYPYVAADATPLYIIAMNDYVSASGDLDFLNRHWDNVWRAYQFHHSTYDSKGLPQNFAIGHGWVEGGPLLPVNTELYLSGLGAVSLRSLANLARLAGKPEIGERIEAEFASHQQLVNQAFWSPEKNSMIFALDRTNQRVNIPSVLSAAPMWFGLFDSAKADATIDTLAKPEHSTDWGMRLISDQNAVYDPLGYHFGSVWPLFTGWASIGEYAYHRPLPAYENLRANALLALDGPLGHVTEVLSGTYYEALPTSSPHQVWSSAMVVSPILRGMLGISSLATEHKLIVAPHVPADWNSWSATNVPACGGVVNLRYERSSTEVLLHADPKGVSNCTLVFSPAVSLHAHVHGIRPQQNQNDQHPLVTVPMSSSAITSKIMLNGDFGLAVEDRLPPLGAVSSNVKVIREQWSLDRRQLRVDLEGVSGTLYSLKAFGTKIASANGGSLSTSDHSQKIEVRFPQSAGSTGYIVTNLTLNFAE